MFFALQRYLRRSCVTTVLMVTPWLPGALAVPVLHGGERPAAAPPAAAPSADAGPASIGTAQVSTGTASAPPSRAAEAPPAPDPSLPTPQPGEVWVEVIIGEQKVRVYRERELIREMPASTGTPDQPTPVGSFRLQNRGEWFFSRRYGQGGFYWVSFKNWGEYLFHSVPTDQHKRIIPEEAAKLGTPASHGCVRLSLEDARWFYENMPAGTRVEIHL